MKTEFEEVEIVDQDQPEEQVSTDKDAGKDEVLELKERFKSLESELRETREDARHWREAAAHGRNSKSAAEPEDEDEDTDLPDLVETLTSNDPKKIKAALKQYGFVDKKEVSGLVETRAKAIVQTQDLVSRFPDMRDKSSDLFKSASKHFARMEARGMGTGVEVMEEAAERAALELGIGDARSGKPGRRETEEDARVNRVRTQQGQQSRTKKDSDDEANDEAKFLVARLRAAGADITLDGYMKRAKSGVRVAGFRR